MLSQFVLVKRRLCVSVHAVPASLPTVSPWQLHKLRALWISVSAQIGSPLMCPCSRVSAAEWLNPLCLSQWQLCVGQWLFPTPTQCHYVSLEGRCWWKENVSGPLQQNLLVGRKRAEEMKEGEEWDSDMFLTHWGQIGILGHSLLPRINLLSPATGRHPTTVVVVFNGALWHVC